MANNMEGLEASDKNRTDEARAINTVHQLIAIGEKVNFNNVHKNSGISRSFLYKEIEIRALIEEQRACIIDKEMNRQI